MRRVLCSLLGTVMVMMLFAAIPVRSAGAAAGGWTLRQRVLKHKLKRQGLPLVSSSSPSSRSSSSSRSYYRVPIGSSSSYSYTSTPIRGVLQIDQASTGASDNAVGTQFVTLITFDATAGNEDLTLSTLKFRAEQGSLSSADQYALYALSASGSMTQVATAPSGGSALTFATLGYILRHGVTQRFVVRARLDATGVSSTLALGFLTTDPLFIQATGRRYGRDLAPGIQVDNAPCDGPSVCRIAVHTLASRRVTVQSTGNLFVTADTTPVPSRELLLGAASDAVLRLAFHATNEDIAVTSLAIGGLSDSVGKVELFIEGSSVPFASATPLQCDAVQSNRFCATLSAGLFTVPQDREVRVLARVVMQSADDGGVSGQTMTPALSDSTILTAVTAKGLSSEHVLAQNDGDSSGEGEIFIGRVTPAVNAVITGSTHDTVAAKFGVVSNASADSDRTPVPFGHSTIGAFRFAAQSNDTHRSILIKKLVFTVTALNVTVDPSSLVLFNAADPLHVAICSSSGTTGILTVTCSGLESSGVSTVLEQGGSVTVGLRANVTQGTSGGTSTLQVILGQLSDRTSLGTVEWSDGQTTFDWVDLPATQVKSTLYRS